MGDATRLTNLAFGKYMNFYASSNGVFVSGDTSPDVTGGTLFYTNNTSATSIAHFDLQKNSQTPGCYEGKIINVVFLDSMTKIVKSTAVKVANDLVEYGIGDVAGFVYHGSAWYQMFGSTNKTTNNETKTLASGNTYNLIVNNETERYALATTNVGLTVRSISGGYVGQEIMLMNVSVGTGVVYVMTDGNIRMTTAQVIIPVTDGALKLVCVSSAPTIWHVINDVTGI